jgi:hypothetical protein
LKVSKTAPDEITIAKIQTKNPNGWLAPGILLKFIPNIPEIKVGGKNAIEKTVKRFNTLFCSKLIKPVMVFCKNSNLSKLNALYSIRD